MQNILKTVIFVWGLLLLFSGLYMMSFPQVIVESYSLSPTSPTGWSALQGNFSAMLTVLGATAILGIWKNERTWLYCTLLLEGTILLGRFVSLISYGISNTIVVLIVGETIIAAIILLFLLKHE